MTSNATGNHLEINFVSCCERDLQIFELIRVGFGKVCTKTKKCFKNKCYENVRFHLALCQCEVYLHSWMALDTN